MRIAAMLMIIYYHLALHGIQLVNEEKAYEMWGQGSMVNKIITCLFLPGGEIGVALFFMISGYFLVSKKRASLRKTVLTALFYGPVLVVLYVVLYFAGVVNIQDGDLDHAFRECVSLFINPVTGGSWWFVSAYFILILFLPVINGFISKLTPKGYLVTLIFFWAVWYAAARLGGSTWFKLERAVFFYLLGGFIRKYCSDRNIRGRRLKYIFCFVVSWFIFAVFSYQDSNMHLLENHTENIMIPIIDAFKTAFFVPVCAISIFRLFESMQIGYSRAVNQVAGTTFGIYLIHDFPLLRDFLWETVFHMDKWYSSRWFFFIALLTGICIFAAGSLIEAAREKWIMPLENQTADKILRRYRRKYMVAQQ